MPAPFFDYIIFTSTYMNRLTSSLMAMAMVACSMQAEAQVYACGGFNGWNVEAPLQFQQTGVANRWQASIDFSENTDFKLSTTKPESTGSEAWAEFDMGVIATSSTVTENAWLPVTVGQSADNQTAPGQRNYTVIVDLDHACMLYHTEGAEIPEITVPVHHDYSGTLPVMFINTTNNAPIVSKEEYLDAQYWIDPMGIEGVQAIGSEAEPLTTQIRGRGNYTWVGFEKKPYRLKLTKKQPLLGMNKSKHFALLAHADDNLGFMRNVMGFAASRALKLPWTPNDEPVEVVLNGEYIGLYFLTETIRVDEDRVNVIEQDDLATTDVDGGWLVEIDNYDSDPHVTVYDRNDEPIWFTYKSPELLSAEQEAYLQSQMSAINDAVINNAGRDDISELAEYVDIDCLARYYIVQQIMQDGESFHGSCYLNRQRGQENKWMFGPVWDFGNAFQDGRGDNPGFIFENVMFSQVWIGDIYSCDPFKEAVKKVWGEFLNNGPESLLSTLDNECGRINVAAVYDAKRWPQYGNRNMEEKRETVRNYLTKSIDWCKQQWGYTAAVADIEAADADAPAVYYNMQGMPVADPCAGALYIRVQGGKATKVRM